jgi:hypothetical protein
MKALFSVLFACFVFSPGTVGASEIISCPALLVGQKFRYQGVDNGEPRGRTRTVHGVNSEKKEVTWHDGSSRTIVTDLVGNEIEPSGKDYELPDCPFKLGDELKGIKKQFVGSSGSNLKGEISMKVAQSFTDITVPAGTFKVVRIDSQFSYTSEGNTRGTIEERRRTSYYSPDLGLVVKVETEIFRNGTRRRHSLLELSEVSK